MIMITRTDPLPTWSVVITLPRGREVVMRNLTRAEAADLLLTLYNASIQLRRLLEEK